MSRWSSVQDDPLRWSPVLRKALAWLEEQYEPATTRDIADAIGHSPKAVSRALAAGRPQGLVLVVGTKPGGQRIEKQTNLWVAGTSS